MMADALARPVTASAVEEASLRGAAVAILERLGHEAAEAPLGEVFHPREERAEAYRSARERQQRLYEELRGERADIEQLSIDTIRTLAMDAVQQANAGHPGTAMALAPLAYLLYTEVMDHNPANPHWPDRDRFILCAGHACILQYSALHLSGYNLSLEELKRFRQWESLTPGHPEVHHTPASR